MIDSIEESPSIEKSGSGELISTGHGMRFYRGPMSQERVEAVKEYYRQKGWTHDDKALLLSFVSPCGRWWSCYDRETSQCYYIDGHWTVNLVTKKRKDDEVGSV